MGCQLFRKTSNLVRGPQKMCNRSLECKRDAMTCCCVFLCLQGGIFQQGIWRIFQCDDLLGKGYSASRKYTRSDEVWYVRSAAIQHRLGYQLGAQSRLLYALSFTHLCYDEPRQASNRQVWQAQVCNSFNLSTCRLDTSRHLDYTGPDRSNVVRETSCVIHWIEMYPGDSAIYLLKNWTLLSVSSMTSIYPKILQPPPVA